MGVNFGRKKPLHRLSRAPVRGVGFWKAAYRFPGLAQRMKNKLKAQLVENTSFGERGFSAARKYVVHQHAKTKRLGRGVVSHLDYFHRAHASALNVANEAQRAFNSPGFQRRLRALSPQLRKDVVTFYRSLIKTGASMRVLNRRLLERHDKTPDVLNARFFKKRANDQMSTRLNRPFSLVVVDIDHFKKVNDSFGHPMGDAVLDLFSIELRRFARTHGGEAGRIGGEEFGLSLPVPPHEAAQLVDSFREKIGLLTRTPLFAIKQNIGFEARLHSWKGVSFTAGVVGFTRLPRTTYESLFSEADKALYSGKAAGRSRTVSVSKD